MSEKKSLEISSYNHQIKDMTIEKIQIKKKRQRTNVVLRVYVVIGRIRHDTCGFCVHKYR